MNADPQVLDLLLTEDQRRLSIATEASRPIGADRLAFEKRRITVADHERFRATLEHPHKDDADLAELLTELQTVERNHNE